MESSIRHYRVVIEPSTYVDLSLKNARIPYEEPFSNHTIEAALNGLVIHEVVENYVRNPVDRYMEIKARHIEYAKTYRYGQAHPMLFDYDTMPTNVIVLLNAYHSRANPAGEDVVD